MKVLVISHNVFCETASMGKTLSAYFRGWDVDEIAQFYIHSEVPTSNVCESYFRITDKEAIKSIFTRKGGRVFGANDIEFGRADSRTDTGKTAEFYQRARKRTPIIYLARNLIWCLSAWNNKVYKKWVDEFNPDIVFFASGDYSFLYRIALKTAKRKKIPLVVSCMDDYYFNNKNKNKFLGRFSYSLFMHQVKETMKYASAIMAICEKMTKDYSVLFNKDCYTLHTPSAFDGPLCVEKTGAISYLGALGYQRYKNLVSIGRTLKNIESDNNPGFIDVYSSESRPEVLKWLTEENGIHFHGQVDFETVKKVIGESLAVIHTELFDEDIKKAVRYSVSTKVADSLASGTCLFAFGPSDVASFQYIKENQAGIVASSENELEEKLKELLTNPSSRRKAEENAVELAKKNHNSAANTKLVYEVLKKYCNVK